MNETLKTVLILVAVLALLIPAVLCIGGVWGTAEIVDEATETEVELDD